MREVRDRRDHRAEVDHQPAKEGDGVGGSVLGEQLLNHHHVEASVVKTAAELHSRGGSRITAQLAPERGALREVDATATIQHRRARGARARAPGRGSA